MCIINVIWIILFKKCNKMSFAMHFMWEYPHTFVKIILIIIINISKALSKSFVWFNINKFHIWTVIKKIFNALFIFQRRKCTGWIKHHSTWAEHFRTMYYNAFLYCRIYFWSALFPRLDKFIIFSEHTLTRTRCIYKNLIKEFCESSWYLSWVFIKHTKVINTRYFNILK